MQTLPNEGIIDLQTIRILEYGNHFIKNHNTEEETSHDLELNFDYDKTLRFTKTRSLDDMMFAFTKK